MNIDVEQLILNELQDINKKLDNYIERITIIETQIKPLFPNGQPGTLAELDKRITDLERLQWKIAGAYAVLSTLAVVAWEWVKAKLF